MNKIKLQWTTAKRKVNDLIPYDKNPRVLSPQQEMALKKSLNKFNLVEIPAINTDNKIIAGHQRIKILQLLGRGNENIEVRIPNRKLTKKEYEEYLLRSNANVGDWDYNLLREIDINLLLNVGFDETILSNIWEESLETEDDNFNVQEEIKKIKKTKIKPGDIFQLGKHILACSDSTDLTTIKKVMGNTKANMVYCDPPFNIGLDYNKGIGGKNNYGGKINDKLTETKYQKFIQQSINNALTVSKPDVHIFYYCDQSKIGMLQNLYKQAGVDNKRVCLWIKNGINPTPQIAFNRSYEPCIYGTKGKPYLSQIKNLNEILNKEIETGNRTIDDILDILDIWLVKRIAGQKYTHPTEKPPTLHEKALRRCTKINDIVLDLFAGSGSTLMACEMLKRRCYTFEINPTFCQLIINRFESYANTKAKKIN